MGNKRLPGKQQKVYIRTKTEPQAELLRSIEEKTMVIAKGSAGTGKTYCTAMAAVDAYLQNEIDYIVITRPNVPTGKSLGAYPGLAEDKMANWVRPILNVLLAGLGAANYNYLMEKKRIVLQPMESIRGMSFENSFVICDEAQQLTVEEIKALSTRLGEDSKMILLGDPSQRDTKVSGLEWLSYICKKHEIDCPVVEFKPKHIVRSGIVAELVAAFEKDLQAPNAENSKDHPAPHERSNEGVN